MLRRSNRYTARAQHHLPVFCDRQGNFPGLLEEKRLTCNVSTIVGCIIRVLLSSNPLTSTS